MFSFPEARHEWQGHISTGLEQEPASPLGMVALGKG